MINCQRCDSTRVVSLAAHCNDLCVVTYAGKHSEGYVPSDLGVGGGDDVEIDVCLNCGQLQGTWPRPVTNTERKAHGDVTSGRTLFLQKQKSVLENNPDVVAEVKRLATQDNAVFAIAGYLVENSFNDPERVAAGIIAVQRMKLPIVAEAVLDKFYDWDQYQFLERVVDYDEFKDYAEDLEMDQIIAAGA